MINILIRTSGRHDELTRCIQSIRDQTFQDIRLILSNDNKAEDYPFISDLTIGFHRTIHFVDKATTPYGWNLYCNVLKAHVKEGWFFYLDSDDFLIDKHCLENISKHLTDPDKAVICRFKRGNKVKPYPGTDEVIRGKIGGSCIFLHHSQKDVAYWDGNRAADFRFIKQVQAKLELKFVDTVVVQTGNNGKHGL
jgi:glycosyltransferase involved in cell wall biosynthesis